MSKTQSIEEQLSALHDELKSAAAKQDEQAKSAVRTALGQIESAKSELQAQLKDEQAKQRAQETIAKLEEAARHGKKALENQGAEQTHLKESIASAKSALARNQ